MLVVIADVVDESSERAIVAVGFLDASTSTELKMKGAQCQRARGKRFKRTHAAHPSTRTNLPGSVLKVLRDQMPAHGVKAHADERAAHHVRDRARAPEIPNESVGEDDERKIRNLG